VCIGVISHYTDHFSLAESENEFFCNSGRKKDQLLQPAEDHLQHGAEEEDLGAGERHHQKVSSSSLIIRKSFQIPPNKIQNTQKYLLYNKAAFQSLNL